MVNEQSMRKLMLVFVTAVSLLTVAGCKKKGDKAAAKPGDTTTQPTTTEPAAGEPAGSGDDKKPDDQKPGGW